MKRGNTALKRVVSVASVAAMAIAGAVLAAPAASAATIDANVTAARVQPAADAPYLKNNALITKAGDYASTNTYASAGTSATVPVIGVGTSNSAAAIQLLVPSKVGDGTTAAPAFAANDTITVSLTGAATFTSNPTADITRQPIVSGDLTTKAGYAASGTIGDFASVATNSALSDFTGLTSIKLLNASQSSRIGVQVAPDGKSATITFKETDPNAQVSSTALSNAPAYLVTLSGIKLTVKDDATPGAVTVKAGAAGALEQTIAYVAPYTVTSGTYAASKGTVVLPDVSVTETSKNGFVAGPYLINVSGTQADAATPISVGGTVKVTTNKNTTGLATVSTTGFTFLPADISADADSATISGLTVTGAKAGTDVTVSVYQALTPTTAGTALGGATVATQASGPRAVIKQTSEAPRTAGTNRYETAQKIAAAFGTSNTIVLANALNAKQGADALAANFLAGAKGAPIVLTDSSDTLPAATQVAIAQVLKGATGTVTVYVMGKTDSVSAKAAAQAEFLAKTAATSGATIKVVRFDGANRYETSAKAVTEAGAFAIRGYNLGAGTLNTAFLASGTTNADALAAGALSAGAGIPVLLADGGKVDASVAKAVKDLGISQLIVLGGTDRIADAATDSLKADAGVTNVVRVAGSDRYATAAALNTLAYKASTDGLGLTIPSNAVAYLANGGAGFPDALAVGPLAGSATNADHGVLLTVQTDKLSDGATKFLTDNKSSIASVDALGATDRVSDSVIAAAQKAIGL